MAGATALLLLVLHVGSLMQKNMGTGQQAQEATE